MNELITTYKHAVTHLFRNLDSLAVDWTQHPALLDHLKPVHDYMVSGEVDFDNRLPYQSEIADIVLADDPVASIVSYLGTHGVACESTDEYRKVVTSCKFDVTAIRDDYGSIVLTLKEYDIHLKEITERLKCRIKAIMKVLICDNPYAWSTGLVYDTDLLRLRGNRQSWDVKDRSLLLELVSHDDPVMFTNLPGLTPHIIMDLRERLEKTGTAPVCITSLKRLGLYSKFMDGKLL